MLEKPTLDEILRFQSVLTIQPYPRDVQREYSVSAKCLDPDYWMPEPSVIGQYRIYGKVALVLRLHILPHDNRVK